MHTVPIYLKWALVFEEPETRTLWLGKALPRDWLAAGEAALSVQRATTRYGRISFKLAAAAAEAGAPYTVHANVTLPASFAASAPAGGLVLRLRTPLSLPACAMAMEQSKMSLSSPTTMMAICAAVVRPKETWAQRELHLRRSWRRRGPRCRICPSPRGWQP